MDNFSSIFQGILSSNVSVLNIYLDGLEDHKKFWSQSNEGVEHVEQNISSLLTKSASRQLGLRLLNKFLDQCSLDVLEKKSNLWTTLILKACNQQELQLYSSLIFEVLGKLIKRSQQSSELAKSFTSTHIAKVYEILTSASMHFAKYALNCIEICLRTYPGSSGPSRGIIERYLWKYVDHVEVEIVKNCGKCLHLLQQIKGGAVQGINHKTQWKNYQLQLLGGIHVVFNEMFANCTDMYEGNIEQELLPWEKETKQFDLFDPVKKAAQLYIRCRNLIKYLIIALREPFPMEKPILVKKILNVIIRGLGVNCIILEQNPIADNIALNLLLPKLHVDLLELLNVTLLILRGHLQPHSDVILGLIIDALRWTSIKNANENHKLLLILRMRIYESLSLWCNIFNSGNRCETIVEQLFQEILSDVTPTQNEFILKVLSGARKHMSKKARRHLYNYENDRSNMTQSYSANNIRKEIVVENGIKELCVSALCCLQQVLLSISTFIKPNLVKMMQTKIIKICATFYELPLKSDHLYSNTNCRIEIYNVLFTIIMTPHYLCPPPTEMAMTIIQTACSQDVSIKVRNHCLLLAKNLEKLIHPQKESLLFTIEERDIRNTFIKMGQKNVLQEFGRNLFGNITESENEESNESSELLKNLDSNIKNYEIGNNNEKETVSETATENSALVQNGNKKESLIENNDLESIQEQFSDKDALLKEANKVDNISKSPEFVLRVEDDVETTAAVEDNSNVDNKIYETIAKKQNQDNEQIVISELEAECGDEPITKKQKLYNEKVVIKEQETNRAEIITVINNEEIDEDNLLAEIVSQFVDELN
ncbi:proline-, glutamic acid- and leucine-rich protein 1 [Cochliomyia hominivorax]